MHAKERKRYWVSGWISTYIQCRVTKLGRRLYIYIPLRAGYIQSKELASIRILRGRGSPKEKKTHNCPLTFSNPSVESSSSVGQSRGVHRGVVLEGCCLEDGCANLGNYQG
ncbi:hypothetical protein I7I50_04929 [Histoplasma capsulatum G186AR]|uniref:Uncharacterized protein n=1 Tax=Ajellomyces capsulatus TaxID=5037 RepID=A0A8H7Z9M7_AJECA|nr:hypothetical protein I7I52_03187 [Histoplasma capsulatum]QSS75707.1 hypothetical protein I7I50_04929 [Histoplasma capsulatum G186AR]